MISRREAGRQITLTVRGQRGQLGPDWQVLSPELDEIVRAYLADPTITPASKPYLENPPLKEVGA